MPKGLQHHTSRSGGTLIPTRRPGFGTDRTVSSPLSPRSRLPRRMPCGTPVWLRVRLPPRPALCGSVAQTDRAPLCRQSLVAGVPLEGSSAGRAAGFGPVGRGFEPFPSSQKHPGGMPGGLQTKLLLSAQSLVPRTRNTPANAVRHYSLRSSWSRVRIPPCAHSHVAQTDRARTCRQSLVAGDLDVSE